MKQWPTILLLVGLVVLVLAWFGRAALMAYAVSVGYLGGYLIGRAFGTEGTDPGGGRTSTDWLVWGAGFLVILVAAAIASAVLARRRPG